MKKMLMICLVLAAGFAGAARIAFDIEDDVLMAWAKGAVMPMSAKAATVEDATAIFQKYIERELLSAVNGTRERELMIKVREKIIPVTKLDEKMPANAIEAVTADSVEVTPTP